MSPITNEAQSAAEVMRPIHVEAHAEKVPVGYMER